MLAYEEDYEPDGVHFRMVMTSKILVNNLRKYGSNIVGLDAVWKYTKYKTPVWIVVFPGWDTSYVGAYFLCSDGTAEALTWCLKALLSEIGDHWHPLVMIDHDDGEKKAVESVGVKKSFILLS